MNSHQPQVFPFQRRGTTENASIPHRCALQYWDFSEGPDSQRPTSHAHRVCSKQPAPSLYHYSFIHQSLLLPPLPPRIVVPPGIFRLLTIAPLVQTGPRLAIVADVWHDPVLVLASGSVASPAKIGTVFKLVEASMAALEEKIELYAHIQTCGILEDTLLSRWGWVFRHVAEASVKSGRR